MASGSNQLAVIKYLLVNDWKEDGNTYTQSFKIITAKSYPLAGAKITTGGKPRFSKNGWKVGVGLRTTVIYRRPRNPATVSGQGRMAGRRVLTFQDWEMYTIDTKNIVAIRGKLRQLGLTGRR